MTPLVSERVSIHVEVVPRFGNDNSTNPHDSPSEEFVDNYNIDSGSSGGYGDDNFTLSEKIVPYLGGHVVLEEHWTAACKATLVFFAGS